MRAASFRLHWLNHQSSSHMSLRHLIKHPVNDTWRLKKKTLISQRPNPKINGDRKQVLCGFKQQYIRGEKQTYQVVQHQTKLTETQPKIKPNQYFYYRNSYMEIKKKRFIVDLNSWNERKKKDITRQNGATEPPRHRRDKGGETTGEGSQWL